MDWTNVNLTDGYEREQNILGPYNFDTLLLEISCNIPKERLTREEIEKQFKTVLALKVSEAKEIFKDNLENILKQAIKERE